MTEPTAAAERKTPAGPTGISPDSNGDGPEPTSVEPPSSLDRLREQYAASTEDRREIIPIAPGRFTGNLAARYAPIPWDQMRKMQRRFVKRGQNRESELNYFAKVAVEACESIMVRLDDGGDFVELHTTVPRWKDGGPVVYDTRLAELLGIEDVADPVWICRLVFKNEAALSDHYVSLDAFLTEAVEVDEDEDEDGEGGDRPT